jgi:Protein of unknown function (DUF2948)
MPELKLIAFDADDLAVISAHLQDAVLKVGDIAYLPKERRFAAVGNRFDWADALTDGKAKTRDYVRRQMALRFERVLGAKLQGIDPKKKNAVLALLAIAFEPAEGPEDPSGHVTLNFADGAAIRLEVECIEAELKDLGPVWRAKAMPRHPDDDPAQPRDT